MSVVERSCVMRRRAAWWVLPLLALLVACGSSGPPATRFELRQPVQTLRAVLVAGEPWRLEDGTGRLLATLKVHEDRVKVRDASDREIMKVKRKDDGWEVEDATGARYLRGKRRDGGWKVLDGADAPVATVTSSGQVLDARGGVVALVGASGSEVVFRDAAGTSQAVWTGGGSASAGVWLMLPATDPTTQAALVVYSLTVGGP